MNDSGYGIREQTSPEILADGAGPYLDEVRGTMCTGPGPKRRRPLMREARRARRVVTEPYARPGCWTGSSGCRRGCRFCFHQGGASAGAWPPADPAAALRARPGISGRTSGDWPTDLFQALDKENHRLDLSIVEDPGITWHTRLSPLVAAHDLRRGLQDRFSEIRLVGGRPKHPFRVGP